MRGRRIGSPSVPRKRAPSRRQSFPHVLQVDVVERPWCPSGVVARFSPGGVTSLRWRHPAPAPHWRRQPGKNSAGACSGCGAMRPWGVARRERPYGARAALSLQFLVAPAPRYAPDTVSSSLLDLADPHDPGLPEVGAIRADSSSRRLSGCESESSGRESSPRTGGDVVPCRVLAPRATVTGARTGRRNCRRMDSL